MEVTILDMRRNPKKILEAIARNETVTLTNRGKRVARIEPLLEGQRPKVADHEGFGIWANRDDMAEPARYLKNLRKGRFDAI